MCVSNQEFAYKVATFLASPALATFAANRSSKCSACNFSTDPVTASQHSLNCGRGGGPQRRHDMLRDAFASMFKSAHLPTRIEVRAELPGSGNGGPDIVVQDFPNAGQTTLFDVSVINPVQNHLLARSAAKGLAAAEQREKEKIDKYRATAEATGARLTPLVFETSGAMGQHTITTINSFSHCYATRVGTAPPNSLAVHPATAPASYWKHIFAVTHAKGSYAMHAAIKARSA